MVTFLKIIALCALSCVAVSAQAIFGLDRSSSFYCSNCCEDTDCTYNGFYSLTRTEMTTISLASQASCSGSACDCYSSQSSSTIADITLLSKKGKRPVIVNCTGSSATSITLNFLKPLKDKNGTYWPYPFDGNCANNTDALKQINGRKMTAAVPSCPSEEIIPLNVSNAVPNCVWSYIGCNAVIKDYPAEDALILQVNAIFPEGAYDCTYGGGGSGSVSCSLHQG